MEREGSFTKAMKHYQNALEVNPDHQVAFDCKEKLRVALEKKVYYLVQKPYCTFKRFSLATNCMNCFIKRDYYFGWISMTLN